MFVFHNVFPIKKKKCILWLIFKDLRLEINPVMHVEKVKELHKSNFIFLSEIFLS